MRIISLLLVLFFINNIKAQSTDYDYLKVGFVQLMYVDEASVYQDSIIVLSISKKGELFYYDIVKRGYYTRSATAWSEVGLNQGSYYVHISEDDKNLVVTNSQTNVPQLVQFDKLFEVVPQIPFNSMGYYDYYSQRKIKQKPQKRDFMAIGITFSNDNYFGLGFTFLGKNAGLFLDGQWNHYETVVGGTTTTNSLNNYAGGLGFRLNHFLTLNAGISYFKGYVTQDNSSWVSSKVTDYSGLGYGGGLYIHYKPKNKVGFGLGLNGEFNPLTEKWRPLVRLQIAF